MERNDKRRSFISHCFHPFLPNALHCSLHRHFLPSSSPLRRRRLHLSYSPPSTVALLRRHSLLAPSRCVSSQLAISFTVALHLLHLQSLSPSPPLTRLKLGNGFQYELNAKGSTPAEVLGMDYKSTLKPVLSSSIDEVKRTSMENLESLMPLQQLSRDMTAKIDAKRNHIDALQSRISEIDSNTDGLVDFTEFVAATLHVQQLEEHDSKKWQHISQAAFEKFDVDRDGYITPQELRMHTGLKGSIDPLLEEADIDKDKVY